MSASLIRPYVRSLFTTAAIYLPWPPLSTLHSPTTLTTLAPWLARTPPVSFVLYLLFPPTHRHELCFFRSICSFLPCGTCDRHPVLARSLARSGIASSILTNHVFNEWSTNATATGRPCVSVDPSVPPPSSPLLQLQLVTSSRVVV